MKRLSLITIMISFFTLAAHAQVATPYLDASAHSKGPAAVGWRYNGIVSAYAGSVSESKITTNRTATADEVEVGEVTKTATLPTLTAAYRGEEFGAELYYANGIKTTGDSEWTFATGIPDWTNKTTETQDDLRLNLAYVFGETLSLGLGYWNQKWKEEVEGDVYIPTFAPPPAPLYLPFPLDGDTTINKSEISLMVSWRLMEMIYLAGGIENVAQNAEASGPLDYDDNSWSNTVFGVGIVVGEPEESQFRVEYAMSQSPESIKEGDMTTTGDHVHHATDTTYTSLEAKFGSFLVTYRAVKAEEKEIDDTMEFIVDEDTTAGIGWMPFEGFSIMAYAETSKKTKTMGPSESVSEGSGYAVSVSWLF